MTGPALYWYFKSKPDILFEYLDSGLRMSRQAIDTALTDGSPAERLRQFVRAHVTAQLAQLEATSFGALYGVDHLAQHLPAEQRSKLVKWQRLGIGKLREILAAGVADGSFIPIEVGPVSLAITTMCDYAVVWYRRGGRLSRESVADLHSALALRMVLADPTQLPASLLATNLAPGRTEATKSDRRHT
jgi:AcrR family transcriptional regulator